MKQIIAVVSGKGGVGKSTVAVGLAVAMARRGLRMAVVDADFYGPSVPVLLGGGELHITPAGKPLPLERCGIKYISIGLFLGDPDTPVIWRGPMFHKAMKQLFEDVEWGEIDCCVVDMPPGTGDAVLSLSQIIKLTGALVVTTPSELAMADVRKAINMLQKINVDIVGIVENMAGFKASDGSCHDIFGSGGGAKLADSFGVPLLCSIPIEPTIRELGDRGEVGAVLDKRPVGKIFETLALKVTDILATKPKAVTGLRIVKG